MGDFHAQPTIVQQQVIAHLGCRKNFRVGQVNALGAAGGFVGIKNEGVAGFDMH